MRGNGEQSLARRRTSVAQRVNETLNRSPCVATIDIRYSAVDFSTTRMADVRVCVEFCRCAAARSGWLVIAMAAMWLVSDVAPSHAGFFTPSTGTWCAYEATGLTDCSYFSYQQCMATLSGIGGTCGANLQAPPVYYAPPPRRVRYKHHKQAHS
jgi:Protein of unknown function (DUF3551)